MMRKGVRLSCSLIAESQQQVLRNVSAFVLRCNSTATVTQARPDEWDYARPFEDIPGPKPLPIIGNTWRFIPYIGELSQILEDSYHKTLHEKYGKIMKISGLLGVKDMVWIFDPDEIEKVFRNEGPWPIRETLPSAKYYRMIERKNIFQGVGGLVITNVDAYEDGTDTVFRNIRY